MGTAALRYPASELVLGSDGERPATRLVLDDCCADPICVDPVALACSFIDLLPTGPMWDRTKAEAREAIQAAGGIPDCDAECWYNCSSMVTYAIYLSQVLYDWVSGPLRSAVIEADPNTAGDTLDDWLRRFEWVDCYRSACFPGWLASTNTYTTEGECGREYCAHEFPVEFERALKHNIVRALARLSRGIIKNVDGINWVIEPLGARLVPVVSAEVEAAVAADTPGDVDSTYCHCTSANFQLEPLPETGCYIQAAPEGAGNSHSVGGSGSPNENFCQPGGTGLVEAVQTYTCTTDEEDPVQLMPGVLAAECIVRSLMPAQCPSIVTRAEFDFDSCVPLPEEEGWIPSGDAIVDTQFYLRTQPPTRIGLVFDLIALGATEEDIDTGLIVAGGAWQGVTYQSVPALPDGRATVRMNFSNHRTEPVQWYDPPSIYDPDQQKSDLMGGAEHRLQVPFYTLPPGTRFVQVRLAYNPSVGMTTEVSGVDRFQIGYANKGIWTDKFPQDA